jgi:hypothetical protein
MYDDSFVLLCLHRTNQDRPSGIIVLMSASYRVSVLRIIRLIAGFFRSLVGDTAGGFLASELLNVRADFISLLHNISVVHLIT